MRAVVVLGCRLVWASDGALDGAAGRRVRAGAEEWARHGPAWLVVSGGRVWDDVVEADGMGSELRRLGVAPDALVLERCSQTTRENARFTAAVLARRGVSEVSLVTCDWHGPRAAALFRRLGMKVVVVPAPSPASPWYSRLWHLGRERVARRIDRLLLRVSQASVIALALVWTVACHKQPPVAVHEAGVDASPPNELAAIAKAEDRRRSSEVIEAFTTSHDLRVRRRAAEALARIADAEAEPGLMRALEDEDREADAWGAYGLGFGCKGREEARVRALAARAASLGSAAPVPAADGRNRVDPLLAIARAVGRCGGALAERVLVAWVRALGPMAVPAAYGLGDVARSRGGLTDDASSALLSAGEGAGAAEPEPAFLYPFGRVEQVEVAFAPRVIELARRALARPGPLRPFAIRALAHSGRGAAADLEHLVEGKDASVEERAEAGRGLSLLGEAGRAAASAALARLTPDKDPLAIAGLGGDEYGVLLALLDSLGGDAPKEGQPALRALSTLTAPGAVPASLIRRISEIRCRAAGALAAGAWDAEILRKCDLGDGAAFERAKLVALVRRPIVADRRVVWSALAKSPRVRVREEALEAIGRHPEIGDAARVALTEAIASGLPGVVATAAEVVQGHPDRLMVLSQREIKNALNPAAPPPTANPSREVDRAAAAALDAALAHPWSEDLVETRVGLLDAAAAVRTPSAHEAALKACVDPNVTVREHALKDLRVLGDASAACPASGAETSADAGEAKAPTPPSPPALGGPVKVKLDTDAGELVIVFEPDLAPVAAARFVELARKGFYNGIVVHRVVPGFVAQFGDPGGDGYGGSGSLLRCETSPVPFGPLDVGVALSGRDTGSSQIFVTLARYPHLDGEYARVGHAEGDWGALAEGDLIHEVKVED